MAQTIYASFADIASAEKAAGALLDHGVQKEDISLVANDGHAQPQVQEVGRLDGSAAYATNAYTGTTPGAVAVPVGAAGIYSTNADPAFSGTTYAANTGSGVAESTRSFGDRIAEGGDRLAGAMTGAVGAHNTAANYQAAATEHAIEGDVHAATAAYDRSDTAITDPVDYDASKTDRYGDVHASGTHGTAPEAVAKSGITTTTPEDAGEGAVKGTVYGLSLGLLAGLASLLIPGVGLIVGGGALATALGGAALAAGAGAAAGGVAGYLKDQGVPETQAQTYHQTVQGGGALLAVNLPSNGVDTQTAQVLLNKYGAADVSAY